MSMKRIEWHDSFYNWFYNIKRVFDLIPGELWDKLVYYASAAQLMLGLRQEGKVGMEVEVVGVGLVQDATAKE